MWQKQPKRIDSLSAFLKIVFRETNNRILIRTHVARMGGKFASPRCRNSLRKAFVEFYLREKGIYSLFNCFCPFQKCNCFPHAISRSNLFSSWIPSMSVSNTKRPD
ncbi:MAG: hypothetical protein ACLTXW_15020 [Christensenellales bacterium]